LRVTERDDEAWREIVENYGDRPDVPVEPRITEPTPPPEVFHLELYDDEFVPPPMPPAPETTPERRLAWLGLALAPILLVVTNLAHRPLPTPIPALLVVGFLAAFCYLVATMSTEPRDPYDDGARL
jgi:hypothetical protein